MGRIVPSPALGRPAQEVIKRIDAHEVEVDANEPVAFPLLGNAHGQGSLAVAAGRVEYDILASGDFVMQRLTFVGTVMASATENIRKLSDRTSSDVPCLSSLQATWQEKRKRLP